MTTVELNAIGAQDKFLTVQPQISYFKTVFRRHTNFSRFTKLINKNSSKVAAFGDESLEYKIGQEGDLLSKLYFEVVVKGTGDGSQKYTVNHFGNSLIKEVSFHIGDFKVDSHTGKWLQVESELTDKRYKQPVVNQSQSDATNGGLSVKLIDANDNTTNRTMFDITRRVNGDTPLIFGGETSDGNKDTSKTFYKKIYIPLKFFFNKNLAQSLPLCALHKHEVKIRVKLETENNLLGNLTSGDLSLESINLYGEFIKLDTDERSKFINTTLNYLIETVQSQTYVLPDTVETNTTFSVGYLNANDKIETPLKTFDLDNFKHPVKYIAWVVSYPGTATNNPGQGPCYFVSLCSNSEYGNDGVHGSVRITLDGSEKEATLPMSHYTRVNPLKFCNCIPSLDRIGLYSFAEAPFEPQPSGSCNFSRINNVEFHMKFANDAIDGSNESIIKGKDIHFFAVNYNVLRIDNGMAGLQFY